MQKSDQQKTEKKKGFLATIWESMTKTGGCCGSGGDCCGPAEPKQEPKGPSPDVSGESTTK